MIYFQILRTVDEILDSEESKLIFDLQSTKEYNMLLFSYWIVIDAELHTVHAEAPKRLPQTRKLF